MDYILLRSRRRTLAIEVNRAGQVIVRAPLRCPQKDIDAFLERRRDWIAAAVARQKERAAAHPPLTEAEIEVLRFPNIRVEYEIEDSFKRTRVVDRCEVRWDGQQMSFPEDFAWEGEARMYPVQ